MQRNCRTTSRRPIRDGLFRAGLLAGASAAAMIAAGTASAQVTGDERRLPHRGAGPREGGGERVA